MSWVSEVFSSSVGTVIGEVGEAIDSLVTSDEERLTLKNKLVEIQGAQKLAEVELENKYETEISKRNTDDQIHGNFLTKSIRPIFLVWVMFIITVIVFGGMAGFAIPDVYVPAVFGLAGAAVTFFFGSKGIEIFKHGKLI